MENKPFEEIVAPAMVYPGDVVSYQDHNDDRHELVLILKVNKDRRGRYSCKVLMLQASRTPGYSYILPGSLFEDWGFMADSAKMRVIARPEGNL